MSKTPTENPLESISSTIAFDSRDWSTDKNDAWIYGIVLGWADEGESEDALNDVAETHRWTPDTVDRLKRLRKAWLRILKTETH